MQWSKEEEGAARKKVKENSAVRVPLEEQGSQLYAVAPRARALVTFPPPHVITSESS